MKNYKQITTITFFIMVSLVASGCASVAPWERGILAKPQMAVDPHPMQSASRAHNYGSREAGASAHSGSGGGGCGCF